MYIDFLSFFSFLIYYFFLSVYILMAFPSTTKKSAVIRSKSSCWKNVFLFFFLPFFFFFSVRLLCVYAGASADVFQMRPNYLATRVLSPQKKLGDAYRHGRSGGNFR